MRQPRRCQPRRLRSARDHPGAGLCRAHQGRSYHAGRAVDDCQGSRRTTRSSTGAGRPGCVRQRQGDAADHREGRRRATSPPRLCSAREYQPAVELFADGGEGRDDRSRSLPIPGARPRPWRRSAFSRRGSAPTRSRSPFPRTSTGRSISTWRASAAAAGKIGGRGGAPRDSTDWRHRQGRQADVTRVSSRQGGALLPLTRPTAVIRATASR